MKETIYFRHDVDAHNDPKLIKIRMKFWREGIGLYWATLEVMRCDANALLSHCDRIATAFRLQCDSEKYALFLDFCVEIGLFVYDKGKSAIYSSRLQEDVEFMRMKSKKSRASAMARWKAESNANALRPQCEGNAIKDNIRKEKKIYTWVNTQGEEKNSSPPETEKNETEILSEKKNKRSEEKKQEVNSAIEDFKKFIVQSWIAYKGNKERQFMAHILHGKEFGEHCERLKLDRMEYARKIVVASMKLPFLKGWVCGGPEDVYRRHATVYNEFLKQKELKQKTETPGVYVPTPPPEGLYSKA